MGMFGEKKTDVAILRVVDNDGLSDTARFEYDSEDEGNLPARLRAIADELLSNGQEVYIYRIGSKPTDILDLSQAIVKDIKNSELSLAEYDMPPMCYAAGWGAGERAFSDEEAYGHN